MPQYEATIKVIVEGKTLKEAAYSLDLTLKDLDHIKHVEMEGIVKCLSK